MKHKDLKISLIFALIGLVAGIFLGLFQIETATEELKQTLESQLGNINLLIVVSGIQVMVQSFVLSFIGLKIQKHVHLHLNFKVDKNGLLLTIIFGFLTALIISGLDKFIFASYLPGESVYRFSLTYFISSILYGGVIEEVMIRLFLMSLVVWILSKLFAKGETSIPERFYIIGIVIAALLFAAGHLPATQQLLGLSTPIVIRAFLLNTPAGLIFGYLYWKKGLTYAILAHMLTHVFNQLLIMPILFSLL